MIAVGCDHAGYELKQEVISHLTEKGYEIMDLGCNGESCDYPIIAKAVAENILNKKCDKGNSYMRNRNWYVHICK